LHVEWGDIAKILQVADLKCRNHSSKKQYLYSFSQYSMDATKLILLLLCLSLLQELSGQSALWRDAPEPVAYRSAERSVAPDSLRSLLLDAAVLNDLRENIRISGSALVAVPRPDGESQIFRVRPTEVMAPALARKYAQIQTFAGQGVDRPAARLRLTLTPFGIHAMVLDPGSDYFVGPYFREAGRGYQSYYRRHLPKGKTVSCAIDDGIAFRDEQGSFPRIGDTLRSYRLAVAATGEYTQYHGGTVEQALAAIVTVINRVNGIYHRDLSIELVLVENNDRLIFTDPDMDPYTKDNERRQNQEVVDGRIGIDNYDIGHVFGTIAQVSRAEVASACVEREKAKAHSRLDNPAGDPFAVDIVAHEIGHQLGANHTFNKCGDNQGLLPFEPGSGSTIMGWPGVPFCESDNFQQQADAYFHSASIRQIIDYVREGEGRRCDLSGPVFNTIPEVEAGPGGWTIPADTPFELIGAATDADGDTLSYSWEQIDAGPSTPVEQPEGMAPLFRSRPPVGTPIRIFPNRDDLLANRDPVAEVLPGYTRPLTFRLTVRDQLGGVAADSLQLQATGEAGPFRISILNQPGAVLESGALLELSWEVAGTDQAPVFASAVDVYLSADGGRTFSTLLASDLPNNGAALLLLPDTLQGDRFRLKVKAAGNVFFDINDYDFAIQTTPTSSPSPAAAASVLRLYPNPAIDQLWIAIEQSPSPATLYLWNAAGQRLRRVNATSTTTALNIANLPPGVYWVEMQADGKRRFARFVKGGR